MGATDREDLEEYAEVLRSLIRQENDLTNHRTTWLLVTQGILFAAASTFIKTHWFPTLVVAVVGILAALSIGHTLSNSYKSRQYLKQEWRSKLERSGYKWEDFAPLDGGFPGLNPIQWLYPWALIPKLVMGAWALLVLYAIIAA
jgi:hypothetical protein